MFITLEGGEGAGKSTQARLLAERVKATGRTVVLTREPGGTPGAEALRALLLDGAIDWSPEAETHLHFAARADHVARRLLPALRTGAIIVCDRFADSTMAYQGYGQGADRGLIAGLNRLLPVQPTLTLLLAVDPATAARRMAARPGRLDRYEAQDAAFHRRVAQGFAEIAAAAPERVVVLSGEGGVADVQARIWAVVEPRLAT